MTTAQSAFKLGVLNMTISFDQPKTHRNTKGKIDKQFNKMHPVPRFIPRYRGIPHKNVLLEKKD